MKDFYTKKQRKEYMEKYRALHSKPRVRFFHFKDSYSKIKRKHYNKRYRLEHPKPKPILKIICGKCDHMFVYKNKKFDKILVKRVDEWFETARCPKCHAKLKDVNIIPEGEEYGCDFRSNFEELYYNKSI